MAKSASEILPPLENPGPRPGYVPAPTQRVNLYKPGQSGNPGGRSKSDLEIRRMLRTHTPDIAAKMLDTFFNTDDERIITVLGKELLYRAFGKPPDAKPGDDEDRARPDIAALSEKERGQLKRLLLKSVGRRDGEEKVE